MEIRTYTNIWNVERKMYSFNDITLPFPLPLKQIGIFMVVVIPWIGLMLLLQVPFDSSGTWMIWVIPPGVATWLGSKEIFHGKGLFSWLRSQIAYIFQGKNFTALEVTRQKNGDAFLIQADYWKPYEPVPKKPREPKKPTPKSEKPKKAPASPVKPSLRKTPVVTEALPQGDSLVESRLLAVETITLLMGEKNMTPESSAALDEAVHKVSETTHPTLQMVIDELEKSDSPAATALGKQISQKKRKAASR